MATGLAMAIVLVAVALTYWRPLKRVRTALGLNHLLATGHVFLVLGFLLGVALGERQVPLTDDLSPIVALAAGWVGFATGMRFDLRVLGTVPPGAFVVALFPAVAAAVVVGGLGGAVLVRFGVGSTESFAAAMVLGAAAATSGPTLVAMIRARRPGRSSQARPVLRMIEFSAGIDDILVVLLAMLAFATFRTAEEPVAPIWLIAAATGGGALLGGVTWLFLGGKATQDERLLLGLGMLAFIAGFAGWLHLSPAAVAAVSAMVLVNLPGERMAQLLQAVRRVERPAVVILMVVIGFHVTGRLTWIFFPLVFALTVLRLLCKRWAGALIAVVVPATPGLRTGRRWGDGLVSQGTLGLMVTLSFFHVWRDDASRTVLAAVAVASIINEIVAPWLFVGLLRGITSAEEAMAGAGREPA
jgi:hypothetical protein